VTNHAALIHIRGSRRASSCRNFRKKCPLGTRAHQLQKKSSAKSHPTDVDRETDIVIAQKNTFGSAAKASSSAGANSDIFDRRKSAVCGGTFERF